MNLMSFTPLVLAQADNAAVRAATAAGYVVGVAIVLVPMVIGVVWCLAIMSRPRAHTICVAALAAVFLALLVGAIGGQLNTALDAPLAAHAIVGAATLGLLVTALALGATGLMDVGKRAAEYDQGKKQAWWAIVLSVGLLALPAYILWQTMQGDPRGDQAVAEKNADDAKAYAKPDAGATEPPAQDDAENAPVAAAATEPRVFEQFNFRFIPPDSTWTEVDAGRIEAASIAYQRYVPQSYFSIVAEAEGVETKVPTAVLADAAKANLLKAMPNTVFEENRPERVAGLDGLHVSGRSVLDGETLRFESWVTSYNGYYYQLIMHGEDKGDGELKSRAAEMTARFSLIDPTRVAHAKGFDRRTYFDSGEFGYRVDLSGAKWTTWPEAAQEAQAAEFAAILGESGLIEAVALHLPEATPPLDDLANAFAMLFDKSFQPAMRRDERPVTMGGAAGLAFNFGVRTTEETPQTARCRVVQRDGKAYFFFGLCEADAPAEVTAAIEQALDSVTFSRVFTSDNAVGLETTQTGRALVLNAVGGDAIERRDWTTAQLCLAEASRLLSNDENIALHYLVSLSEGGKPNEGLTVATQWLARFPQSMAMRSWRAHLAQQNGRRGGRSRGVRRALPGRVRQRGRTAGAHHAPSRC